MDSVQVGSYLAKLRKYYKVTQDELASRLGVTRQAVSRWETGVSLPDIEFLLRLSELYGITINDILLADSTKIRYQKEIYLPEKQKERKKIFVIGCGRWGSFLAWYLDSIGHSITLYGRENSPRMHELMQTRKNEHLSLPSSVSLTHDLSACTGAQILVISVGAQQLRHVAHELKLLELRDKQIVLCMKGIEIRTGRRLSQVVSDVLAPSNSIAVWLGPGHVQEFYRGIPNCMVIDSLDIFTKEDLIHTFSSELIRFYSGTDLLGNEIGAAAKNVMGIAAGMLEGLDLSSLKGALMARGTREISRLIEAMGGNANTAYGLCHLGDYEATLFSEHSQNLSFGKMTVLGETYGKLAEGYYTVAALRELGNTYQIELPICETVYQILYEKRDAASALHGLFRRSLKTEF